MSAMNDLNLVVPVGDTRSFTEEKYAELMNEVSDRIVFTLQVKDGAEAYVIKNAADDYLVWFIGSTYRNFGEDLILSAFHVTCVEAYYDPHAALSGMCLQMKIDTEMLQEEAYAERHNQVIPGDEE